MNEDQNSPLQPEGTLKRLWLKLGRRWRWFIISLLVSLVLSLAFRNVVFLFLVLAFPMGDLFKGSKK